MRAMLAQFAGCRNGLQNDWHSFAFAVDRRLSYSTRQA